MATASYSSRGPVARGALGRMSRNPASPWRHVDLVLVGCVAAIGALGCLMIFSSTRGPARRTSTPASSASSSCSWPSARWPWCGAATIDYRRYRELAPLAYGGAMLMLLLVVSGLGTKPKGAQAWFQLGASSCSPPSWPRSS